MVFLGYYGMDDLNYSIYAAKLIKGEPLNWNTSDHFELRWVPIYLTAFFYKLFGINDFSSAAFGIFTTLLAGFFILKFIKRESTTLKVFALILFFLNYNVLYASHRLWPDTGVAVFAFLSFYVYYKKEDDKNQFLSAGIFTLLLFLSFLSKETTILLVPLWIFFLLRDLTQKRNQQFWIFSAILIFLVGIIYLGMFYVKTGDWFYRYTVLTANQYEGICDFARLPFIETAKRLGYTLWNAFLLNGDMIFLYIGLCGFIYRKKIFKSKKAQDIALAFIIVLISANFMTISFTHYVPLCHDPRHFMFLFPFSAILGAYIMIAYYKTPKDFPLLLIVSWTITILVFIIPSGETKYIYLLISLVLLVTYIRSSLKFHFYKETGFILLITFILLIRPVNDIIQNRFAFYKDLKGLITERYSNIHSRILVLTGDVLTTEISEHTLKYVTGNIQFEPLESGAILANNYDTVHLLVNKHSTPILHDSVQVKLLNSKSLNIIQQDGLITLYEIHNNNILFSLPDNEIPQQKKIKTSIKK